MKLYFWIFFSLSIFRCEKERDEGDDSSSVNEITRSDDCSASKSGCFDDPYLNDKENDSFDNAIDATTMDDGYWAEKGINAKSSNFNPSSTNNRIFLCSDRLSHAFFRYKGRRQGITRVSILGDKVEADSWAGVRGPRGQFWIIYQKNSSEDRRVYYSYQKQADGEWLTPQDTGLKGASSKILGAKIIDQQKVSLSFEVADNDFENLKKKFKKINITEKSQRYFVELEFDADRKMKENLLNAPKGNLSSKSVQNKLPNIMKAQKSRSSKFIPLEKTNKDALVEWLDKVVFKGGSKYSVDGSSIPIKEYFRNNVCP